MYPLNLNQFEFVGQVTGQILVPSIRFFDENGSLKEGNWSSVGLVAGTGPLHLSVPPFRLISVQWVKPYEIQAKHGGIHGNSVIINRLAK